MAVIIEFHKTDRKSVVIDRKRDKVSLSHDCGLDLNIIDSDYKADISVMDQKTGKQLTAWELGEQYKQLERLAHISSEVIDSEDIDSIYMWKQEKHAGLEIKEIRQTYSSDKDLPIVSLNLINVWRASANPEVTGRFDYPTQYHSKPNLLQSRSPLIDGKRRRLILQVPLNFNAGDCEVGGLLHAVAAIGDRLPLKTKGRRCHYNYSDVFIDSHYSKMGDCPASWEWELTPIGDKFQFTTTRKSPSECPIQVNHFGVAVVKLEAILENKNK